MDLESPLQRFHCILWWLAQPQLVPKPDPEPFSTLTRQTHQFLNLLPSDAEYLILGETGRERLKALWQPVRWGESEIDDVVHWSVEEEGVRVKLKIISGLSMILVWEVEDLAAGGEGKPDWRFLTLVKSDEPGYEDTLEKAMTKASSLARPAPVGIPNGGPVVDSRADGEGSTPGAYGAPEDFWAGWDDDEDQVVEVEDMSVPQVKELGLSGSNGRSRYDESDEDDAAGDAYWGQYGSVDSAIGDGPSDGLEARDRGREVTKPASTGTRSRRSSTIRAPIVSPPPVIVNASEGGSGTATPIMWASNGTTSRPSLLSTTSPLPPSSLQVAQHDDIDADVMLALKGIWKMYSRGGEVDQKKVKWMEMMSSVTSDA